MGYQVPLRRAEITFEGTDYDGLRIECVLDVSLRGFRDFMAITDADEEASEWIRLAQPVWNVDAEGDELVPVTVAALMDQPIALKNTLITTWVERAATPSLPLGGRSTNGVVSVESLV